MSIIPEIKHDKTEANFTFNIGIENHLYSLPYCIAFILSGFYYPEIVKKKVVIYPLYILIAITITSLISAYL